MEWDVNKINEIVEFINNKLASGATMISVEREYFNVNERVIHKRLIRAGYKKVNNQYITNNITPLADDIKPTILRGNSIPKKQEKPKANDIISNIDIDKLNLLLNNLDKLLKLIPSDITSNITHIRSGRNDVKSLRIDTGIYDEIKKRASRDNINIADIVNKALEDYLNNYL